MHATNWVWGPPRPMWAAMGGPPHHEHEGEGPEGRHGPRGRRRRGPRGRFPGGFPPFPPGAGLGFPGRRGPHSRKASRGDIRAAVLALLAEQPLHGYQIIQEITERTEGVWRPSPGSVYPTLAQLEDEGLVRTEQVDGRRVMHLTEEGDAYVAERRDELNRVWDTVGGDVDDDIIALRDTAGQVWAATMQVMSAGTPAQREAAQEVLAEARRKIYQILAE